jgi:hypothetical protein
MAITHLWVPISQPMEREHFYRLPREADSDDEPHYFVIERKT